MKSYLSHLECTHCGRVAPANQLQNVCSACGKILYPRYDLEGVKKVLSREDIALRPANMWRYYELMPVINPENVVTLGEGMTPLIEAKRLGKSLGCSNLMIKEEGLNPTGTFKARGLSVAVSKAKELGVRDMVMPSAGNAGSALAAYAAKAGMGAYVFLPDDTPEMNKLECIAYQAQCCYVQGNIADAGRAAEENSRGKDWFSVSTLKEPYRVEGKKTMGIEIVEQLGWSMPDAIIYPTGGGTGILGMWKAFDELEQLGWIGKKRPKMICVQSTGCAPIVKAFNEGSKFAEPWPDAQTIATGLKVPSPFADYLILGVISDSKGTAIAVTDTEIIEAVQEIAHLEGILVCPEGAATLAGLKHLLAQGFLNCTERIVLFNTGSGLKYPELVSV